MKYAWVARHKGCWPAALSCEVLGVNARGYFEHWRKKGADKPSRSAVKDRLSDEVLLVHIKARGPATFNVCLVHSGKKDIHLHQSLVDHLAYGAQRMIGWNKVFEMPHREKAFGEAVGSAHGVDLLVCDGKTNSPESTFGLTCLGGGLRFEVFQQPARAC